MQNLAHIQETELANNGLYEVIEGVSTRELDPEIVRLKGGIGHRARTRSSTVG